MRPGGPSLRCPPPAPSAAGRWSVPRSSTCRAAGLGVKGNTTAQPISRNARPRPARGCSPAIPSPQEGEPWQRQSAANGSTGNRTRDRPMEWKMPRPRTGCRAPSAPLRKLRGHGQPFRQDGWRTTSTTAASSPTQKRIADRHPGQVEQLFHEVPGLTLLPYPVAPCA